jgi:transposase
MKDETWEHINATLRTELREADGREPEPSAAILDSQAVKTTDVKGICNWVLEIVERDPDTKGFQVLPRCWIVGRTFGWLSQSRRLSKDHEVLTETSGAMVYAAVIHLMVRRLVRHAQTSGP